MNQSQPDLEKKSRELSEREQVLNAREDLLSRESALNKRQKVFDEAGAKLDVLNKQIKAKEDILASRSLDLDDFITDSQDEIASLRTQKEVVSRSIKTQEDLLSKLKMQCSGVSTDIKTKKHELSELQTQIKDTKQYRDEQSKLSEDTIAQWNSTLVEFRSEADLIQHEKNKLSSDIIRLEQDKTAIAVEVNKEQSKLESLSDSYLDKVETYKASLRSLDTEVSQKRNELEGVINATQMKLKEVETREKSVRLKEGNISQRQAELDQKERRLKMNYGIAGIDYEDAI